MSMRVRFLVDYRDRYGVTHKPGDVAEYIDHLGAKLCRLGVAAPAPVPKKVETMAVEPPQNAARRTTKPTPRRRAESRG